MLSALEALSEGLFTVCSLPWGLDGKESACNAGDLGSIPGFDPWVGKILLRREWQSTPVFLPGESHRRRSPVGYSPWGRQESDTTEQLTLLCSARSPGNLIPTRVHVGEQFTKKEVQN